MKMEKLIMPRNSWPFIKGKLKSLLYKLDNSDTDKLNNFTTKINMMIANSPPNKP